MIFQLSSQRDDLCRYICIGGHSVVNHDRMAPVVYQLLSDDIITDSNLIISFRKLFYERRLFRNVNYLISNQLIVIGLKCMVK